VRSRVLALCLVALFFLSGCTEVQEPITRESEGLWNEYVVYPISQTIIYLAQLFGNNFGIAIIIVTVMIRVLIFPLMVKQIRNTKAMGALQPEIEKLKEQYPDKDAHSQQQLQEKMMELFSHYNVNPLSGCLPILIQMPILVAFFHAITRTKEISENNFLWMNLGSPDPYYFLPIIAGITTYMGQKLIMAGAENDNPQMAMMLWVMPVMIVIFALNFPAALSLYWSIGNIFMIAQSFFVKDHIEKRTATLLKTTE
jgi:YidC/Oxa1 family membrane protein insertase